MQEFQTSEQPKPGDSIANKTALKPYQKPVLLKIDDELTGVESGASAVPESSCGVLS